MGILLVLALVAVGKLYADNQALWKCALKLQNERLTDTRRQFEIVDGLRECMETVVKALREARGATGVDT